MLRTYLYTIIRKRNAAQLKWRVHLSNHDRRTKVLVTLCKKLLRDTTYLLRVALNLDAWDEKSDIYNLGNSERTAPTVFFIGDSQAEFLSRGNQKKTRHICAHIGPVTLMKCGLFGEPGDVLGEKISEILRFITRENVGSAHIAISLGTIDVKTFIYLLKSSGTIKDDDDLRQRYRTIIEKVSKYLTTVIRNNHNVKSCGLIEIMPPNILPYSTPNKKDAFKYLRSQFDVNPVMGSLDDRLRWTKILNEEYEAAAKASDGHLKFISVMDSIRLVSNTNVLDHTLSYDGIHLSNKKVLTSFGGKIYKYFS